MLSKRIQNLKPSAVMALVVRAQKLKDQGVDVISLSIGEPTNTTSQSICDVAIKAIQKRDTKYTPSSGTAQLKKAIVENTKKWLNLDITTNEVTVSIGAKFILYSAIQSLCDLGDEVLVPSPYWVSYPAMVELAQAQLISMPTKAEQNFKLQPEILEKHITKKTKILMLNSPNNPSGTVYTQSELKALGEVLKKHKQVYILSDDIYNHLYFLGNIAPHLLHVCPELQSRVLVINAVSKNYSMTGWRVGWAIGDKQIIKAMSKLQSQSVSCAPSISQAAAAYALIHCDQEVEKVRKELIIMRDFAVNSFKKINRLDVFVPEGTFYLWVGVKQLYGSTWKGGTINSCTDFVEGLLQEKAVLCVPGKEFNYPGYVRIHFAVDKEKLLKACTRIQEFILSLNS